MKKLFLFIFLLLALNIFANEESKISNELSNLIKSSDSEFVKVNIFFNENFNYNELEKIDKNLPKKEFRKQVFKQLKSFSDTIQGNVIKHLIELENKGFVKNIISIPINNVLNCTISLNKITELQMFDEIELIDYDSEQKMVDIPKIKNDEGSREITWNVLKINANDVWQMGYTGEGVIVAVIDTGVNYNHHDLEDHMWENDEYPNHGYDFINNDNNPIDDMGHGTHCAGTVAGDGTSGSQTGVAPDAIIMALKVLRSDGSGSESAVWQAMDFALQHNADVISLSLGWQHSWGPNRTAWRNAMISLKEAGIPAAVAAGNEGDQTYSYPVPDNVRTPGDCPPPWLHPDQTLQGGTSAAIVVGASTQGDAVASFSSVGPVQWDNASFNDYPYQPEMGLIRPDVIAPGTNIKSLNYQNDYGYVDGWDGTSMATPCVAGTIALMLSKNYTLQPSQIDEILETTAYHLSNTKNNSSGSGRIDALEAINNTPGAQTPPEDVVNPIPADNSTNTMTGIRLHWDNGFGGLPEYYKVYIGTDNPPSNIVYGEIVDTTYYDYAQGYEFSTTYYWRIEAYNEYGNSQGTVWSFSTISQPDEDFETNDFTSFDWQFSGSADWNIDSTNAISGNYCAKSGDIYNNQYSAMQITMEVSEDSEILFWKKVSSEENYDKLKFYIDNSIVAQWSGESEWSQEVFPVTSGTHTFKWKYLKLNGGDEGEDCAWIDYIVFPTTGTNPPPELVVTPLEFNINMSENSTYTDTLYLQNIGGQNLTYNISVNYTNSQGWISLSQSSGTIAPNGQDVIFVTFYTSSLTQGSYLANLVITDNQEETSIPITLNVENVNSQNNIINFAKLNFLNYPNPFNPTTTLSFFLSKDAKVKITVYNIKGEFVAQICNRNLNSGMHTLLWEGKDDKNKQVKSGIYLFKLELEGKNFYRKGILLK